MAYVRKKGRHWHIYYADSTGRWTSTTSTAATKTEALRLKTEIEQKVERQRLGLDALPTDPSTTFWQLCEWWLDHRCKSRSRKDDAIG